MTSPGDEAAQVRKEGSPQITRVIGKTWKCDWDLFLIKWFKKCIKK
jgi:hypothetical protein